MASAQAQAFFDKQPAADRMKIIDSWGGRDMTDEWFKNAQAAGSAPAAGAPAPAAGAAPSVADVRAATTNASEDFARFNDATVAGWGNLYDAAASQAAGRPQYRSSRGAPGTFDKPTECPAGQSPSGPDESSPCKGNQELLAAQGAGQGGGQGAGGAAGVPGAQAGYFGQDDPLQRLLTNQMSAGAGSFAGTTSGGQFAGGGVFSEGAGQYGKPATTGTGIPANPAATAALGALAPAPAPVGAPVAPQAPAPASYSDPYEAWKQGGRQGMAPGSSALAAPVPTVYNAPAASKPADVFGTEQAAGSLDDLVNPRRARRDARTGGNWF